MEINYKKHWNNLYNSKKIEEVSWYQKVPQSSLDLIISSKLKKDDPIIDIGGGDSFLVDFLLENSFTNITVLDISNNAIERAKLRLGNQANDVKWIISDIKEFIPKEKYALWHDRAVFHFMSAKEVDSYYSNLLAGLKDNAKLVLATFSENGPEKCCGLNVSKYSIQQLVDVFDKDFIEEKSENTIHKTPSGKKQAFSFIKFIKK